MADIFDELTKEVKDEKIESNFVVFMKATLHSLALLVVIFLFKDWIDVRKLEHNRLMGDTFHKALLLEQNNQTNLANESFEYFLEETKWYSQKELVKLHRAKSILDSGDLEKAQDAYYDIFAALYHTDLTRAYARLVWCILELNKPVSSTKYTADQLERCFSQGASKKNALHANGSILYSLWLIKNERPAEAKKVLEELMKEGDIPSSIMTSATAILSNLSI
jgi:hypothetical protein